MEGKRGEKPTRAISRTSSERCDSNSDLGLVFEDVEANADILAVFLFSLVFRGGFVGSGEFWIA